MCISSRGPASDVARRRKKMSSHKPPSPNCSRARCIHASHIAWSSLRRGPGVLSMEMLFTVHPGILVSAAHTGVPQDRTFTAAVLVSCRKHTEHDTKQNAIGVFSSGWHGQHAAATGEPMACKKSRSRSRSPENYGQEAICSVTRKTGCTQERSPSQGGTMNYCTNSPKWYYRTHTNYRTHTMHCLPMSPLSSAG